MVETAIPRPRRAAQLRHDLLASTTDGCLFCAMVGIGESYLALFVLAAGYSKVAAGLVTTVPFLLGALISLLSKLMERDGSAFVFGSS